MFDNTLKFKLLLENVEKGRTVPGSILANAVKYWRTHVSINDQGNQGKSMSRTELCSENDLWLLNDIKRRVLGYGRALVGRCPYN